MVTVLHSMRYLPIISPGSPKVRESHQALARCDHTIAPRLPLFTAQIRLETDGLLPALPIQFTTDAWPTSAAEAFTPWTDGERGRDPHLHSRRLPGLLRGDTSLR